MVSRLLFRLSDRLSDMSSRILARFCSAIVIAVNNAIIFSILWFIIRFVTGIGFGIGVPETISLGLLSGMVYFIYPAKFLFIRVLLASMGIGLTVDSDGVIELFDSSPIPNVSPDVMPDEIIDKADTGIVVSSNAVETDTTFPSLLNGLKVDSDTMAAILGQEGIEISSQYNDSTTINQSGQIISNGISTGSHISVDIDGTKNVVITQSGETIKVDSLNIIHGGPLDGATVFHNPDGTFYVSHNGMRSEVFNNNTTSLINKSIV